MNYLPNFYKPIKVNENPTWPDGSKMTLEDIIERGLTEKCEITGAGHNWILLPQQEGQKQYIICLSCSEHGHT